MVVDRNEDQPDRVDGSWTVFGLPQSHWHCQLTNFEWDGIRPVQLPEVIDSFLDDIEQGENPHLILTGPPGIGKSHLSVGIFRRAVVEFGTLRAVWLNVPKFCDKVKARYGDGEGDPFEHLGAANRLVVFDDFLGRDYSPHEVGQILYRLIDLSYMNGAAILITMNHPHTALREHFRSHEISRIMAGAKVVAMQGRDRRLG